MTLMYKDGSTKKGTNYFRCGKCSEVFDEKFADKHENITWLGGLEHDPEEEKKKEESQDEEEKEKKDKMPMKEKLEEIAKALKKLMSQESDDDRLDELEELQAQLDQMVKTQDELDQLKEEDEKKQSKQASVEFIGVEPYHNTISGDDLISGKIRKKYSVLTLKDSESVSGDSLFIRMGSTDDHTVGDSSDDKFLQSLGSVD